ncbi:FRG domain-containing protein [Enterococcus casseliflavus]|uniref:FRG domain-containing protein n=1 Tax=Enterococcus casseliflavus TaxID=37734 RepID=UPI002DB79FAE|nr:FRG domain-containing protein [Enterococcus casseliflavus]MEB6147640.1 FRG domain-containing protein [Enterococcus casseliflavus]
MKKVKQLSDFLQYTKEYPNSYFYRGENMDYGETACVATAVRDSLNYDMYSKRIEQFDRSIREQALFDRPELMLPYAQHSGLSTKLLDVTSNPLVALYFACQQTHENQDGYIYVFDDYADITDILEKYPKFDIETELLTHLEMIKRQHFEGEVISFPNDKLHLLGKCIEQYRNKYLRGGYSKHSTGGGVSKEDSLFLEKLNKLREELESLKKIILSSCSLDKSMKTMLLPKNYTKDTPAIDFLHPYREERYKYYNEQYKEFDVEVREYLISLECLIAFVNDKSPVGNLASMISLENLNMEFLPNFLYKPVLTFKRGLSQQSFFFLQTLFDKHELNVLDGTTMEVSHHIPRQLIKCQANHKDKIIIDGESKNSILAELDRIGVNKASMFGDADSIADYIMNMEIF